MAQNNSISVGLHRGFGFCMVLPSRQNVDTRRVLMSPGWEKDRSGPSPWWRVISELNCEAGQSDRSCTWMASCWPVKHRPKERKASATLGWHGVAGLGCHFFLANLLSIHAGMIIF